MSASTTPSSTTPINTPPTPSPDLTKTKTNTNTTTPRPVSLLILGAGWLFQFLGPQLQRSKTAYAATSTTGRPGTIKFKFEWDSDRDVPAHDDSPLDQYRSLPSAKTVLITFPVKGAEAMKYLLTKYEETHPGSEDVSGKEARWILLGSTGIYGPPGAAAAPVSSVSSSSEGTTEKDGQNDGEKQKQTQNSSFTWFDRHSPATNKSPRYEAEQYLLYHHTSAPQRNGCVLNLAGLFGEPTRDTRIFELATPRTKDALRLKKSVHFVHGWDVARVILRVCQDEVWDKVSGQRWLVSDTTVYDWWDIVWRDALALERLLPGEVREGGRQGDHEIGDGTVQKGDGKKKEGAGGQKDLSFRSWILELLQEENIRALPRPVELLGRALDARDVWSTLGISPVSKRFGWPGGKEEDER